MSESGDRLTGNSKSPIGVNVSATGCLCLCASSAAATLPLAPRQLRLAPTYLKRISGGWMDNAFASHTLTSLFELV